MGNDTAVSAWEHARQYLPFGKHASQAEVLDRLLAGRAQLWSGASCAGVGEITDARTYHIWLAGGSLTGLLAMLPDVERFARLMDCTGMELSGRKGWQRIMKRFGYAWNGQEMVKVF